MLKFFSKFIFISILFSTIFYVNIYEFSDTGIDGKPKQQKLLVAPPLSMKHFTLGYNDVIADLMWVRLLQDLPFCEKDVDADQSFIKFRKLHDGTINESLSTIKIFKGDEYEVESNCRKGWGFNMLNFIFEISPRFHAPALFGPLVLAVFAKDVEGASILFDKTMKNFPNDWQIMYNAGFHFLFEAKDPGKAAGIYFKAAELGAPDWVNMLAARLHTTAGRFEIAKKVLTDYRAKFLDKPDLLKRIDQKLKEIEKLKAANEPQKK
jgi:hypothetical protein